jgi:hypothetical protein
MRRLRAFLLTLAALFALLATPVAFAAGAQPETKVAAIAPCSSPCPQIPGNCGHDCLRCDLAMTGCTANAGCGMLVAVAPQSNVSCDREHAALSAIGPPSQSLHGRAIKPETHPPSLLDQQA